MAFNPLNIGPFKRGDPVKASDQNDLLRRLERLERITAASPIQLDTSGSGLVIGFDRDAFLSLIDFYRFVEFQESISPEDTLFTCKQIKRNKDRTIEVIGKEFQFGNLFRYCASVGDYGLVIKLPNGNKEWTLLQTVCPDDVCSSGV